VLLGAAQDAARKAGVMMLSAKGSSNTIKATKANSKDLLTETDLACQHVIYDVLGKVKDTRFLGEEDVPSGAAAATAAAKNALTQSGICWVVDPIDGTANFVDSIPLSTISIAAVDQGETLIGVVYDPFRDELFSAVKDQGATLINSSSEKKRIVVSAAKTLEDAIVYAGAPPTLKALQPSLRGYNAVAPKARTMRLLGSAALMLAYVAAGRGAAYFEADLAAWDTAAGSLLIAEAGGKVTDADGQLYRPASTRQIVATNGHIHDQLLSTLEAVDGARLDN